MRTLFSTWIVVGLVIFAGSTSGAAEWGNLSGRFLFEGEPPVPEKLKITSDQEVCGKHDLRSEWLLVNPKNKGVQNIIVYLYQNKSGARLTPYDSREVPIHDDYLAREKEVVKLDNLGCRFDPHVALVWTRQQVVVGNSDPVGHNVKIDCRDNPQSNDTIPSGGTIEKRFDKAERFPVPVSCSIHPWMKGWLVIRDTPYMAVTDGEGKFEIKNLPAGEWQFMFWQEQAGYVSQVKVKGKAEEWKRGLKAITIKAGPQDLGDIVLAPDLFKN
ncbi:MAG: cupredoxin domain-containing protein [Pirellulaceae bacterium]